MCWGVESGLGLVLGLGRVGWGCLVVGSGVGVGMGLGVGGWGRVVWLCGFGTILANELGIRRGVAKRRRERCCVGCAVSLEDESLRRL